MTHGLKNVKVSRDNATWEVEVRAEIPSEGLARHRDLALKEIQKEARLDGFRPGKAPLDHIVAVYGESAIMRRAAEQAIQHQLLELFAAEKLLIIESPRVVTEAPVLGKVLSFTARAALAPRVELPDYKKIAEQHPPVGVDEISVSDDEHAQAMTHLRRERARIDKIEAGTDPQKAAEESRAADPKDLPALDDAFVATLGYENADKFRDALRANIKNEKGLAAREKRRAAILDDLVKNSKISYPAALREYELDDMETRMKEDLIRTGTAFEAYLTQAKKTREQLREEWKAPADKRTRVRLILSEIARKESIEPDGDALGKEVAHAREHYPQADVNVLRTHIAHAMRNEAVLRFLEHQNS